MEEIVEEGHEKRQSPQKMRQNNGNQGNSERKLLYSISLVKRRFYCLAEMIFSVSVMVLCIIVYFNFYDYDDESSVVSDHKRLVSNWQSDVITDIRFEASSCPTGYESAIDYVFPGLYSGCECMSTSSTSQYYQRLYKLIACTSDQLSAGCTNYAGLDSKDLRFLRTSVSGLNRIMCVKRLSGNNFALRGTSLSACPSGQILCGGTLREYQLCIDSGQDCPINQISLDNSTEAFPYSVTIDGTQILYYTRTANKFPQVEFRATQGLGVCMNNEESNISPLRNYHPFTRGITKQCDVDSRFTLIEGLTNTETQFYDANNNYDATLLSVPQSSLVISSTVDVDFYVREYIHIGAGCRKYISDLVDSVDRLEFIKELQFMLLIASFVYVGVAWMLTGIYFYFSRDIVGYSWVMLIWKTLLFTTIGVFICVLYYWTQDFNDLWNSLIEDSCFDTTESWKLVDDYKDVMRRKIFPFNLSILIVFLVAIFFEIWGLFESCSYKLQNQKKIIQQKIIEQQMQEMQKLETQAKYLVKDQETEQNNNAAALNTSNPDHQQQRVVVSPMRDNTQKTGHIRSPQQFQQQQAQYVSQDGAKTPRNPLQNAQQQQGQAQQFNTNEAQQFSSEQFASNYNSQSSNAFFSSGQRKNNNLFMQQRQNGLIPKSKIGKIEHGSGVIYENNDEGMDNMQSPNFNAPKTPQHNFTEIRNQFPNTAQSMANNSQQPMNPRVMQQQSNIQSYQNHHSRQTPNDNSQSYFDSYMNNNQGVNGYMPQNDQESYQFDQILKNISIDQDLSKNRDFVQKIEKPTQGKQKFIAANQINYQNEPISPEYPNEKFNNQSQPKQLQQQQSYKNQGINEVQDEKVPLSSRRYDIPQYGQNLEDDYDLPHYSPHNK